jgi:hypothetical protein
VSAGPLTRWRKRLNDAGQKDDPDWGAFCLALDRTRSCFKANHALQVLEHTPDRELLSHEVSGFKLATDWLREELAAVERLVGK